ncbi:Tvp18p Ecym_7254 [Eremothecium cymbalariae DBVPG|uniref:Golgi apparatus membrane protein TVP18 n=1 Tax=Eremothecium cymbalariae (strain CBS 270.75 / DBVPG 7215 / KCTC 17166 / NRRL Y-17582) TaxID=931890 RepID=G8JW83_ERECY|nr:hypothetical protein Ecym_7254 [Eremothecium cymbalariae DBVPG\
MAVSLKSFINVPGIVSDLKSFNFSVYGRWFGYINIILCIALGIANIFHFGPVIIFSILALGQGFFLLFVEVPFLVKICPLSERFVSNVKIFNSNMKRTMLYGVMAVIQWVSLVFEVTSLVVLAICLTVSAIFYASGWLTKQEFKESNVLRGPGSDTFPHEASVREML